MDGEKKLPADAASEQPQNAVDPPGRSRVVARYGEIGTALAKRRDPASDAPPTVNDVATAAVEGKSSGAPLDAGLRTRVEAHVGAGLGGVRVHGDALAQESSAAIGARAFTYGSDVFLGAGESPTDPALMSHELTHVVQQGAADERAVQRQVEVGAANSPAETQADQVAADVVGGGPPAQLIADGNGSLEPGQMTKEEFMRELWQRVTQTADEALGPMWSAVGCPYIDSWFQRHAGTDAPALDRLARRYSGLSEPRAASEYLAPICNRVREGISRWRGGGDVSADLAAAGMSGASAAAANTPRDPDGAPVPAGDTAQRKTDDAPTTPSSLIADLGEGAPLEGGTASRMGEAFGGEDFSSVRVHTGPEAARKVAELDANALAVGEHVAFAPGEYAPATPRGDAMLAHELAHTVQQRGADPEAMRQPLDGQSEAHETDADRAAGSVMSRLWGGTRRAVSDSSDRVGPALRSGYQLQRCQDSTPVPGIVITDPFVLDLQAKLEAGDKPGFFGAIGGLGGSRAGDGAIREGLELFLRDGKLTGGDAFRAVALQELGPDRSWSEVIRNFAEGVDGGAFRVVGLAPAGAEPLREFCMRQAGEAAEGTSDLRASYRTQFNAKWDSPTYSAHSSELDPTLDSKGPRNQRARHIFNDLYTDATIQTGYDGNTPAGFRQLCDTHAGPDGINLIASPRLQELRATLDGATVTASATSDAAYTTLVGTVRPKAEALEARDRQEIGRSHQWRLDVDRKVMGTDDASTNILRGDLWSVVTTSRSAAPVPSPSPVPEPEPVPEPVPTPNAAQRTFLRGITLAAPAGPVDAESDSQNLDFQIRSAQPNPALAVRRRVVVEPAAQVVSGQQDESDWASGANAAPHSASVNPETAGGTSTTFTARLTMPPLPTSDFAEKTATVAVEDKRLDWFKREVQAGVTCVNQNDFQGMSAGSSVPFKGGQVPIRVRPRLPRANPGLTVFMQGELKRGGAVVHTFTRAPFPVNAQDAPLFDTILTEASPPAAAAEPFEAEVRFSGASGPAFHTVTLPFSIDPNLPAPSGGDAAQIASDNAYLNVPIGTAGFLDHMSKGSDPTWVRVANAVNSGALKVQACMIRSDAATHVTAKGRDPTKVTAYAMGAVSDARTLIAAPGAAGWRWGGASDTVFLNVTPRAGSRRSLDAMAEFLAHEGIHAADRTEAGTFGRYSTEFRAYWVMGTGSADSTAFDPSMSGVGPKSPRARTIFRHLYGSSTYPFVKPAYDGNVDGFRERVDNLLYPDGINLTLSAHLTELRTEIEGYSGSGYAAKKAAVAAKFGACAADDRAEITNNRMWRDLVEEKFTGSVWVSYLPPAREREADQIKSLLGIPR